MTSATPNIGRFAREVLLLLLLLQQLLLLSGHVIVHGLTLEQVMAEKEANVRSLVNATERVFSARCSDTNLCVVNTTRCTFSTCGGNPTLKKSMVCDFSFGSDTSLCGKECAGLLRSTTTSAVSVAAGATNNQEASSFICSTASLTEVFADLYYNQGVTGWQYVASNTGVTRTFPAASSTSSCAKPPDTRQQSWYVSASTGPKDIVFVCDFSGSMNAGDGGPNGMTRAAAMKVAVVDLLGSLGPSDRFNIVAFTSSPTIVGTSNDLMAGTPANVKLMQDRFKAWPVGGGTTFGNAMTAAFNLLKSPSATGCARLVMFLTDGQPGDGDAVYTSISAGQSQLGSNRARVFTYSLSSAANHARLQSIACSNTGIWSLISDASSPTSPLQQYYNFLAAGIVASSPQWTAPYASTFGQGQIVTVSMPCFDKSTTPKVFVGVAAIDVLVTDLLKFGTLAQLNSIIDARSGLCLSYDLTDCQMQKLRESSTYVCPSPAPPLSQCTTTHVNVPSCNTTIVTNINEVVCASNDSTSNAQSSDMSCCSPKQCRTATHEATSTNTPRPTITIQESFSKTLVATDTWSTSVSDEGTKTLTLRPTATSTASSSVSAVQTQTLTQSASQSPTDPSSASQTLKQTVTDSPTATATASASEKLSESQTETQSRSEEVTATNTLMLTLTERITPSARITAASRSGSPSSSLGLSVSVRHLSETRSHVLTLTDTNTFSFLPTLTGKAPTATKSLPLTLTQGDTPSLTWQCVNTTQLLKVLAPYPLNQLMITNTDIINGFNQTFVLPPLPGLEDESLHLPWFEPFTIRMYAVMRPTSPSNTNGFALMPGFTANITLSFANGLGSTTLARANHTTLVNLVCPPHPNFDIYAGEAIELRLNASLLTFGNLCVEDPRTASPTITLFLMLINTPNSVFLNAGQALVTSTIVVAGAAAAAFGGAAPDMQVMIMTAMIPCANSFQKRSFELYRAISPFAITDSFEGVLWGNLIANVGFLALHALILFVYSFAKKVPLAEATAVVWFPNLTLQLMVMTYPGTAFATGQQLIHGDLTVQQGLLATAMLLIFVIGYPVGMLMYIMRNVEASFDRFEYHRWKREASGLRVRLLSRFLLPIGSWDPPELRRRFGTIVTLQCRPEYLWITYPAWSPLIVAVLGLFDFDDQNICIMLYVIMLILHILLVAIVVYFKPFRSMIEDWFAAIALGLTSLFIAFTIVNLQLPTSQPAQTAMWVLGLTQMGLLIVRVLYHIAHIFIARNLRNHVPHVEAFRWNMGYVDKNSELGDGTEMMDALMKEEQYGAGKFGDDFEDLLNLTAEHQMATLPIDEDRWWRELELSEKKEKEKRDDRERTNSAYIGELYSGRANDNDDDSDDEYQIG